MGPKASLMRVVLDTNVLVSALLFGGVPGQILDLVRSGMLVPLVSRETFAELRTVLSCPKFQLSEEEVAGLLENECLPYMAVVEVRDDRAGTCSDPDDDKFVACAVAGKARFLVTGDRALLALGTVGAARVVTVRQLLASVQKGA
ncbi:MAG: putative toxin-antitoxin system toxin component, PIN family [Deltaproteobacteria bacterium]|nr:putative toxin-antitoxin system toxin component, PIN family [Deltaproteobacteria bacterium]